MKKYKIILVSLSYKPSMGGLVSYLDSFSKYLSYQNYNVEIHCTNSKNENLKKIEFIDNIEVRRYDAFRYSKYLKIFTPIMIVLNLKKELEKLDGDFIIICRHIYFAAALSLIPKMNKKVVFLVPLISPKLEWINLSKKSLIKKIYSLLLIPQLYFLEKMTLNKLENIAVLSNSKKEELESYYSIKKNKINIASPGINLERYNIKYRKLYSENILKKYGINKDIKIIISTVCRLVEEKNVESIIMALDEIVNKQKHSNVLLIIVGDGPLENYLKNLVINLKLEDYVIFTGYLKEPEEIYYISNIFVLASFYEGFGHVFLEANACGTPVIGIKNNPPNVITASEDIIKSGINGLIADDASTIKLSNAILELISKINIEGMENVSTQSFNYVRSNFSWLNHMICFEGIFNED